MSSKEGVSSLLFHVVHGTIIECRKLKKDYDECSKDLVSQFWKDFNVKNFFACDQLFQVT